MNKKRAKEILMTYACCMTGSTMCDMCPWDGTYDCEHTKFSEKRIRKAVRMLDSNMRRTMKLSDIKIKESFAITTPKEEKMKECRNNWNTYHRQDRYIVVNSDNELIDGYIQYLVLKENGVEEADVKISNRRNKRWYRKNVKNWNAPHYRNSMTTYIYGVHFNKKHGIYLKEYVWRVPDSWKGWENDLLPGDEILVYTQYGIAPIIITKIERRDKCPVDMSVKKVYRKLVNKNA